MSKHLRKIVVVGATSVALLTLTGGQAEASTGTVGAHAPAEVSCNVNVGAVMLAHAPFMQASYAPTPANTATVGPNHVQWVAFRSWLIRTTDGRTWSYTDQNGDGRSDVTPWRQAQVSSDMNGYYPDSWYNTATRAWDTGSSTFSIRQHGGYRVRTEYYWYADSYTGSGSDVLDSYDHFVTSGYSVQSYTWCQY